MTPAYALLRRSRSHQDLSISDQRAAVTAWAAANGYAIVREFADDGSGLDTAKRREFSELLTVCADKTRRQADVVLCYDISRFSRLDADEAAWHEHELRRAGVRVLFTHEPGVNEGGLAGTMVKSLKRAMAHEYSLKLSQVVSRGLRSHAALGHWTGGRPPYGYRRAVETAPGITQVLAPGRWKAKGEKVVLVPDPAEAAVVRDIFDAYVTGGRGLLRIASEMNARGVPVAMCSRRQTTSKWSKITLHSLLRNPIYIGTLVYGKARYSEVGKKRGKAARPAEERVVVEHAVPPIIAREVWDAAQAKHGTRKFGEGRAHAAYLLSGLIVCSVCGRRFRGHGQLGTLPYAVYICGTYHDSGVHACDAFSVRTDYLDAVVVEKIKKRLDGLDPTRLATNVRGLLGTDDTAAAEISTLEARLGTVKRKIAGLVETLAGGDDLPSFRRAALELEHERERIERELVAARSRAAALGDVDAVVERLSASFDRVREVLAGDDAEARRAIVRGFLSGVRIEKTTSQAVLTWYRMPRTGDASLMMVELRGFEPLTPRLPALCSPN